MRRNKEDTEQTRQRLLAVAADLFADRTIEATRLEDIARAAGVTRGAIYWHFGNKRGLVVALAKSRVDPFLEVIEQVLKADGNPLEKLRAIVETLIRKIQEDERFLTDENLRTMLMRHQESIDELHSYLDERASRFMKEISALVRSGQDDGTIRNDVEPGDIVNTLGALMAGSAALMTEFIQKKGNTVLEIIKPSAVADIFIRGIRTG
ncbi:MAG: TetR/AcrR family transcriptional regulator [Candidatus Aminicenantales bacterium]